MPKPVYMLCAESGAVDRFTNLVSVYNIFERIQIADAIPSSGLQRAAHIGSLNIRIISVVMREDADEGRDFDFELSIHLPQENPTIMQAGVFQFKSIYHRFLVDFVGVAKLKPGNLEVFCKIKPKGDLDWLIEQEFMIPIELASEPAAIQQNDQ